MIEKKLDRLIDEWVFAAPDLGEFHERNTPQRREELKKQLKEQAVPIEHYETAYAFFYC